MSTLQKNTTQTTTPDYDRVIGFLTHLFEKQTETYPRHQNTRGTPLYKLQVEFAYIIDDIKRSPSYMTSKIIADANNFVSTIQPYQPSNK